MTVPLRSHRKISFILTTPLNICKISRTRAFYIARFRQKTYPNHNTSNSHTQPNYFIPIRQPPHSTPTTSKIDSVQRFWCQRTIAISPSLQLNVSVGGSPEIYLNQQSMMLEAGFWNIWDNSNHSGIFKHLCELFIIFVCLHFFVEPIWRLGYSIVCVSDLGLPNFYSY